MQIIILGAGIAAISFAYFVQNIKKIKKIYILEKDNKPGGLLRSYKFLNNISYDVGPHIIFSKYKEVLDLNKNILGANVEQFRRSNKILYDKKFIKYPFENELSKLNKSEIKYCINSFINNTYEKIKPENMKQFFLSFFGQGITDLYLEPYNKKIWKFDPSFLDTQMVERIPRPPKADILKSAKGKKTEGYKHQLFFYYPKKGGIQSLFDSYVKELNNKVEIINNVKIKKILKNKKKFFIKSNIKKLSCDKLISTIPLNEIHNIYNSPKKIKETSKDLKFNSIYICMILVKGDLVGNNFAFMVPEKNIIFHRISKLNFFGKNYSVKNHSVFQAEITFRYNDSIDKLPISKIKEKIKADLVKIKFANKIKDIKNIEIKKFKYAYVIYDLNHRKNVDNLLKFYKKKGLNFIGRWGSWEYMNSDQVIYQSSQLAKKIFNIRLK